MAGSQPFPQRRGPTPTAKLLFPGGVDNPLRVRQPRALSLHACDGARASCPAVRRDSCQASSIARAFLESKAQRRCSGGAAPKGFKNSNTAQKAFPRRARRLPHPGSPHLTARGHAAGSRHDPTEPGTSPTAGSEPGKSQAESIPASSLLCSASKPLPSQRRQTPEVVLIHAASQLNLGN